ncbi:MAG: hypothetical protein EAZ87_02835 [Nostocales cyanobacterium]|nr:MAG: hypothetical protein EAZ87_02835 [Nostocales cyanobacterium]
MTYNHRLATLEDHKTLAPLMSEFFADRAKVDPSIVIKDNFNFENYAAYQLLQPLNFTWILEHENGQQKTAVGFMSIYFYDEAPPPNEPASLMDRHNFGHPLKPRRVGSVLGIYIQEEHRLADNVKLLVNSAFKKAAEMKVTDIDVLISEDQTGMQALVTRLGFKKVATQYIQRFTIPENTELPSLYPPHPELELPELPPVPSALPLKDIKTQELVRNSQGEVVFHYPLLNEKGEPILSSEGLPIYPTPLLDLDTNQYIFDHDKLVVYPVLYDEKGNIFEYQGLVQFHPPVYEIIGGKPQPKKDQNGKYVFAEVEKNPDGSIVRTPEGYPVFKSQF